MISNKPVIGIVFGGKSSEHEVSIKSARTIYNALRHLSNKERYIARPIYIDKYGYWHDYIFSESILFDKKDHLNLEERRVNLTNLSKMEDIDIWFPCLHGPNGEDGVIQGLFQSTGKPFVGSGVLGSALGMDKIAMKSVFKSYNLPQVPYVSLNKADIQNNLYMKSIYEKINEIISYPCFIKPANLGSSVGITKAYSKEDFITGIEVAAKYDERIIVEKNIEGRELECGVLGKSIMKSSVVGEVKFQTDWYTYESKYNANLSSTIIPADLNIEIANKIQKLAIEACKAINAYGLARVDFFYQESTRQIYINEVNTLPGFTKTSMYPTLWEASGLKLEKLVASLIETAKE